MYVMNTFDTINNKFLPLLIRILLLTITCLSITFEILFDSYLIFTSLTGNFLVLYEGKNIIPPSLSGKDNIISLTPLPFTQSF